MWMQARQEEVLDAPKLREDGELSPAARRVLRFIKASVQDLWAPIALAFLEPLFSNEPGGALERALSELSRKRYLRCVGNGQYEVCAVHERLAIRR